MIFSSFIAHYLFMIFCTSHESIFTISISKWINIAPLARHFSSGIFKCIFLEENICILIHFSVGFVSRGCNWQSVSISLINGFILKIYISENGAGYKCTTLMPYGNIDLGQHWFRWCLGACRQKCITWTNRALPSMTFWAPSQYKDRLIYVWRFPC